MQLKDFMPDIASQNKALVQSNTLLKSDVYEAGFANYFKKNSSSVEGPTTYFGVEQLYWDFLRTAYAYRRMFIQDLYLLAMDSAEIRTPLLQIKSAIFRKGFDDWQPAFSVKCNQCGKEFEEKVEQCDDCGSADLREPDKSQTKPFEDFKLHCNIFGQSLEEVLKMTSDDVNIVDDFFLFLNKQYQYAGNTVYSKLIEVRRLHPALMEFDLNKDGLPKNAHFLCPFHREDISVKPGLCSKCGVELFPAMYVYNHRGKRIYLLEEELIHVSKFSENETYGYCVDDQAQILTRDRGWQFFKDLNSFDFVATLNPSNNELIYQSPSKIWSQHYSGKMYEMDDNKTRLVHLKVTPNHRLYAKLHGQDNFSLQEAISCLNKRVASQIGGAHWNGIEKDLFTLPEVSFPYRKIWKEKYGKDSEINVVHCPEIKIPMDIWVEFVGYYLSEGNLTGPDSDGGQVCISQNYGNDKWKKIKECLEKLLFPYRYYGHKFIINDNRLHEYLKQFGKCHDKFVPMELKQLSQRQLRILLDALVLGDGHWRDYPSHGGYVSVSKKLLDDVSEIAIKLGYSCRLGMYDRDGANATRITFILRKTIELNKSATLYGGEFRDRLVDYDGNIYCCEVPEYHVLLVRSKGRTIFSGNSPLLTVMQKVLTVSGMDKYLYRYFFERKTPSGMILTYTDDPQSLEIERARVESKLMEDPTYMPWIAVSQKTNRGRTDFIRLWHTLQEMDYLPVRNEIRDRISAIYGVPQIYMNVMEGVGGLSGQSQELKVFSDIIESDQRRYNEKVLPILLANFGITDWKIKLRPPEGKIEAVLIQQSQQKVAVAAQMKMMGFDVSIKPGHENIDTLDFQFSLKPVQMNPMMGGMGTPEQMPPGENGQENLPPGLHSDENRPPHMEDEQHNLNPIKPLEEGVYRDNKNNEEPSDEEDSEE